MFVVTSHDCDDNENFFAIGPFDTEDEAQAFVDDATSRETSNTFMIAALEAPDVTAFGDIASDED